MGAFDLTREYNSQFSASFKKTTEKWGELSNMSAGFPLAINGYLVPTSEALYQACRYPAFPDIQMQIISQSSPMTAKMISKKYLEKTREDWERSRVVIMKWCLRVKLVQNWSKFSGVLLSTESLPIVEVSNKDAYWGARPESNNLLVGSNVLGRLLMELRELVINSEGRPDYVRAPSLKDFLFMDKPIELAYSSDASELVQSQYSMFGG